MAIPSTTDRRVENSLREDALAIWQAAVAAVASDRLVEQAVTRDGDQLRIADQTYHLPDLGRIVVIGGGKAGAGMAAGLEAALGRDVVDNKIVGLINVPADCVQLLQKIITHPGRPPGVNEPTMEGVRGVEQMLALVAGMKSNDLLLILLSGGGSALLPAPIEGITLDDKLCVTRLLMSRGAPITDLNTVRAALSRLKGGQLARSIPAGRAVALIISDVVGDPLEIIASGPTVGRPPTGTTALAVLRRYASDEELPPRVFQVLNQPPATIRSDHSVAVRNCLIGNNATSLEAARKEAEQRGYSLAGIETNVQGIAREVGVALAERCLQECDRPTTSRGWCWLSGGEPIVKLAEYAGPRRGGRNQEVALAALQRWWNEDLSRMILVSGGTDGEDGPTDAAGGIADAVVRDRAQALRITPGEFLAVNNAYPFLQQTEGLILTGPTHTNVMDVRVMLSRSP